MAVAVIRFAFPAGLWLGLSGAFVLAAYLFRRRARRAVVPFIPLWTAAPGRRGGGLGTAVARYLDLLLALLACAAAALAAGAPFVPGRVETVRDLVLVVDGGLEMRAGDRAEAIRRIAAEEIRRRARGTRMAIVAVADEGPLVWSGGDRAEALRFVHAHRGGWLPSDATEALGLGREAARTLRRPDLVFCTYRPGRQDAYRLRTTRTPVRNAGMVDLEVLADPDSGGRLARILLKGDGPMSIEGGGWSGEVEGTRAVEVRLPTEGPVTLRLAGPGDDFGWDDALYLSLPEKRLPRVLVVATEQPSPFLAAALAALEETHAIAGPLDRTTPEHVEEAAATYDLLVFDRCAPERPLTRVRALYLAPTSGALPFRLGEPGSAPAIFEIQRDHPLLRGIDLGAVPPRQARAVLGGTPLARAAPGPVLCVGPSWIALGFDPDETVLAASPAYPLFLRNAIELLAEAMPASRPEFRAVGERAPAAGIAVAESGERWRVQERLLGPPGFWTLGDETLAVDLLFPALDLASAGEASDPLQPVGEPEVPDTPVAAHAAAAALALLLLGWWVYWRGGA